MISKRPRRPPRRTFLAAPLVVTSAWSTACGGPTHTTNPGPPLDPTAPNATADTPTEVPSSGATAEHGTPSRPLSEIPKDGGGKVVKQPDGTCIYVFPPPDTSCPPNMDCNPGPPLDPLDVRCPDGMK